VPSRYLSGTSPVRFLLRRATGELPDGLRVIIFPTGQFLFSGTFFFRPVGIPTGEVPETYRQKYFSYRNPIGQKKILPDASGRNFCTPRGTFSLST